MREELEKLLAADDRAVQWGGMTPERRAELIDYNDEHVRQWRAVCQLCGEQLKGTRAELRAHKCAR